MYTCRYLKSKESPNQVLILQNYISRFSLHIRKIELWLKQLNQRRYQIMKSHKYWSLGALFCMLGCIYSGIRKSMTAHKYFAYSSLLCMGMSIYSGHKLVSPKKKKITESNNSENNWTKNWPLFIKDKVAGEFFPSNNFLHL